MVSSPHLNKGTLALVDIDPERLEKMTRLAEMVIADTGVSLQIESAQNWKDVLKGANFVVLSFAKDTVKYRGLDCQISEKYGIRMCSGDTIGPGGIFRAMRELPKIMECIQDIEALCPDAWVINYINPAAVNGIALARYAPQIKSFALCDSLYYVKPRAAMSLGIINSLDEWNTEVDNAFDVVIAGVNHFTWMLKAEYEGKDRIPELAQIIRDHYPEVDKGAKAKDNGLIGHQLYEIFGKIPTAIAHTKEYVRYWQGLGTLPDEIEPLSIWETNLRYQRHDAMWKQVDDFINGNSPIKDFMTAFGPDPATDIIENMVGNLGKPFFMNVMNNGAVTNMPDDAFLELLCDSDMNGPVPRPVGELPRGIRGMSELILDTHELTAEAVVKQDFNLLRRAMLTDPLVNSIADTDAIIRDLLEAERDVIPDYWY